MRVKPTKLEWIKQFLEGLEASGYTGRVEMTIEFNKGGITRLVPMVQEGMSPDI